MPFKLLNSGAKQVKGHPIGIWFSIKLTLENLKDTQSK
jgi:hypothetical protein